MPKFQNSTALDPLRLIQPTPGPIVYVGGFKELATEPTMHSAGSTSLAPTYTWPDSLCRWVQGSCDGTNNA